MDFIGVQLCSLVGMVEEGYHCGGDWITMDVSARIMNISKSHLMGKPKLSC